MAFGGSSSVHQFVWSEAGEHHFGVAEIRVRIAFLWHEKMAELTENQLSRAICGTMLRKARKSFEIFSTVCALVCLMEDSGMLFFAWGIIAMAGVVWAVPVILPLCRPLLEDILALRT
jgi:hypothetical protein